MTKVTTTHLSESDRGRNIRVAASVAANTLLHVVPAGETHEITLYASNVGGTVNQLDGLWGGTDPVEDNLQFVLMGGATRPELIRDAVLDGPAQVHLRSLSADVLVFGKVVTFREQP